MIYHFLGFNGFYFYDDLEYIKAAFDLSNGNFSFLTSNSNFDNRIGFIIPIAISIFLFGVNVFSSNLIALVSLLGIISLVYFNFKKESKHLANIIVVLVGLEYYLLLFSTKIYPDLFLGFLLLWANLILFHNRKENTFKIAFFFSFLIFWCFLTKLTFIYGMLFFVVVFLYDVKKKQYLRFWTFSSFLFVMLVSLYFGFYKLLINDSFYRFNVIEQNQYPSSLNFSWGYLLKRITYSPILSMFFTGMGTVFLLFVSNVFQIRKRLFDLENSNVFFTVSAIFSLAMVWFMTASLQAYSPILLMGRMFFGALPLMAIASGYFLLNFIIDKHKWVGLLFVFTGILCYIMNYNWWFIYTGIGIIQLVFSYSNALKTELYYVGFVLILLVHPTYSMFKKENYRHIAEQEIFSNLTKEKGKILVLTDERLRRGKDFFYAFNTPKNLEFIHYRDVNNYKYSNYDHVYYILNKHSESFAMEYPNGIPILLSKYKLIFNRKHHFIYEIK